MAGINIDDVQARSDGTVWVNLYQNVSIQSSIWGWISNITMLLVEPYDFYSNPALNFLKSMEYLVSADEQIQPNLVPEYLDMDLDGRHDKRLQFPPT